MVKNMNQIFTYIKVLIRCMQNLYLYILEEEEECMVTLKVCSTMAAEAIEETTKRRRAQTRETLTPSISRDRKMR